MTPEEIDKQAPETTTPEDSPDDQGDVAWISIGDVLSGTKEREPIPIAQVVTAIELKLCFFRDPFGRHKNMNDEQIENVCVALERFYEYEDYPGHEGHPPIDPDTILEDLTDFGWPGDKVPTFQPAPSDSDRPLRESERQRLYRTIYTLSKLLAARAEIFRTASGLNVHRLAEKCFELHKDPDRKPSRGYSQSTFRDAIDEAIKACQEELGEP